MRVLTFCHDSFGLGHLRRTINLARSFTATDPSTSVLCLTGSPRPEVFDLPAGVDLIKLPSITKSASGEYVPHRVSLAMTEIISLRSELIRVTAQRYQPDLILVDHTAVGIGGELLPMLEDQRKIGRARLVLGMRDIVDEPSRARAELGRQQTRYALSHLYHRVMVYGHSHVCDVGLEYGLDLPVTRKLRYVGIACDGPVGGRTPSGKGILATVGGGQDGLPVLHAVVDWLESDPKAAREATIVTGPLMDADAHSDLSQKATRLGASVIDSTNRMSDLVDAAAVVIGMGGYNTIYEALSRRKQVVVVPRVFPRREQLDRARRLESLGLLQVVAPDELIRPGALADAIRRGHQTPKVYPGDVGLRFDGAQVAAETLTAETQARSFPLAS